MDLQVGDFGLAALIEKPGDRKKYVLVGHIRDGADGGLSGQYVERRTISHRRFCLIRQMDIVSR
jgi:hypothetical protein